MTPNSRATVARRYTRGACRRAALKGSRPDPTAIRLAFLAGAKWGENDYMRRLHNWKTFGGAKA